MVMLAGMSNLADRYISPIDEEDGVGSGATALAISARCRFIASVLQKGRIRPAPLPCFGQMAPKI